MRDFNKLFKSYEWLIYEKARKFSTATNEDEQDLISFLNQEFWREWERYDRERGSFKQYIDIRLNHRLINYVNLKTNEFNRNAKSLSQLTTVDEEGNEMPLEIKDENTDIENEVLNERKTDEDKRQLIYALIKNADSLTTAIVNEFLSDDNATPTAIGRKLGVHHQTVRRKLDALARKYYANHDEDIFEYLAV